MIKKCKIHGDTEFSDNTKRSRCKKCRIEATQKRRSKVKIMAIRYKGGECVYCGYKKCIAALEFHHLNPEEKDFQFSGNGYCKKWEDVKKELDKCILLCANCHRELHNKAD
jgi:5-methylcytosine-specific restriction endonuclease McrA